MGIFKKKPIQIEAFQMGVDYIPDWAMDKVTEKTIILHKDEEGKTYADIVTLEGTMRADYGDYVIKGVNGEVYPCKEDIFKKTYDSVTEKTEKEKLREIFIDAIAGDKKIIIYTLFDDKTIESCVYYNNLRETLNSFDEVFDDDLIAITCLCRIVEAAAIENLSEYFSKSSQEKISNRIYEKTGVRI